MKHTITSNLSNAVAFMRHTRTVSIYHDRTRHSMNALTIGRTATLTSSTNNVSIRRKYGIQFSINEMTTDNNVDVSYLCYSTTTMAAMSLRRRRGRSSGGLGSGIDEESTAIEVSSSSSASNVMDQSDNNRLVDPTIFLIQSKTFLDKIQTAMEPLVRINDVMILSRGESSQMMFEEQQQNEQDQKSNLEDDGSLPIPSNGKVVDGPYLLIELGPVHGQYTFIADIESNTIFFQSPISGQLIYYYNTKTTDWCNIHDQHNLEGIFVRDIIRQIQGVPKL